MSRMKYPRLPADLSGMRFGRLTALNATGERKNNSPVWLCQCDCGNTIAVPRQRLVSYSTQSCGCLRDYLADQKKNEEYNRQRSSGLYSIWRDLVRKCTDPKYENYANFGGRGIKMCDEWLENMDTFFKWALANGYDGNRPKEENILDLIDPNGDYCPENCRWVDQKTQTNNTRKSQNRSKK